MKIQTITLIACRLIAAASQAVLYVLLARDLAPAQFGIIAGMVNVVTLIILFASFGNAQLILTERSKGTTRLVEVGLSASVLISYALVAISIGLGVIGLLSYSGGHLLAVTGIMSVALTVEKNADTRLSIVIADGHKFLPGLSFLIRRTGALVVFIGLSQLNSSNADLWFAVAYLAGAACALLMSWLRTREVRVRRLSLREFTEVTRLSWPYLSNNLTTQARTLDVVLVSSLTTAAAAGIYAAAFRLASPVLVVTSALSAAIVPHAVRSSRPDLIKLIRRTTLSHLVAIALTVSAGFAAAPYVIKVLGSDYSGQTDVLTVLSVVVLTLVGLSTTLGSVLQAYGRQRFVARAGIATVIVLLPLLALGCVLWGVLGAAFVSIGVYVVKCAWFYGVAMFSFGSLGPAPAALVERISTNPLRTMAAARSGSETE